MERFKLRWVVVLIAMLSVGMASAQDLWDGTMASSFSGGTGTQMDPYQIRTGAELVYFASLVNEGDDFSGKYVKLMNAIDMNQQSFSVTGLFTGDFDGGGYFITMMLGVPTNNNPFMRVGGRIHHLGVKIEFENEYKGLYYGNIALVYNMLQSGILEDCYYSIQTTRELFYYQATLAYNNGGIVQNCCAEGRFNVYGGYTSTSDGAQLVYNNTGVIENCFAYVNEGKTGYGNLLPLSFTNSGTIVHNINNVDSLNTWVDEHPGHSRWTNEGNYKLVDFNPHGESTVSFVDELFNVQIPSFTVTTGSPIGELPVPNADCTFIGWTRYGKVIQPTDIVESDWTLFAKWEQRIRKQPTLDDMSIEVDDIDHASFQWCAVYGDPQRFDDWQSTNHEDGSSSTNTISVTASAGQRFQFTYRVSSESDYDYFYFSSNGITQFSLSGYKSGSYTYTIPQDGDYSFVFRYSKDESTNAGDDMVIVNNICLTAPETQLECTQNVLSNGLATRDGLYYCMVSYSNTNAILTSDTVTINTSQQFNYLEMENVSALRGMKVTIPVNLINSEEISSIVFNVTLPENVSLLDKALGDRAAEDHRRSCEQLADGSWLFTVQSPSNAVFNGSEGSVLYLIVDTDENLNIGDYIIEIKDIELTTQTGKTIHPEDRSAALSICTTDDVNGDGSLNISDVTALLNKLLHSVDN